MKKAKRKAHSEVRWVLKYPYGFGGMLVHHRGGLPIPVVEDIIRTKVRVTEILPTPKRKTKR